ncbi:TAXI family TRAP transporter solute-binding subunit, partial [Streptococcus pyogenes]
INKLFKALTFAVASFSVASTAVAEDRSYILATASTGGTYYPVGVALATLSKVKLAPKHHFSLSAISSAGSGENVKLLNEDEAQFAILQG